MKRLQRCLGALFEMISKEEGMRSLSFMIYDFAVRGFVGLYDGAWMVVLPLDGRTVYEDIESAVPVQLI